VASAGDRKQARIEIRTKHEIPQDAFVVLFAGKFTETKCPLHFLQAIHECKSRGLDVWALMVGDGPMRTRLEVYIRENKMSNVVLTGFINQSLIAKYYAASQVITMTSMYEPKGQVVPEAGTLGCPAILSDQVGCIGPNDCARPGENALVYPWGVASALADQIGKCYHDSELYRSMTEAAERIANLQDATLAAEQMKEAAIRLSKMGRRRAPRGVKSEPL
jgi:glycosyltransferase involved in cell wall biosynthesis